jgi:hypothetical protein
MVEERLAVGRSNELIGVFAGVAKDVCDLSHCALFAAGAKGDVDTGEAEHHLLEGMGNGTHVRGQFKQALD